MLAYECMATCFVREINISLISGKELTNISHDVGCVFEETYYYLVNIADGVYIRDLCRIGFRPTPRQ